MTYSSSWRLLAATTLTVAFVVSGCQSQPKRGPKRPQPPSIQATQLLPSVKFFEDTDGNGFLDTVEVTLYVFSEQYPDASVYIPGAFEFKLTGREGRVLREWKMSEEQARAAVRRGPVGPGYIFRLSLLDGGSDKIEETSAELFASFVPPGSPPVKSVSTTVRIGRTGRL